MVAVVTAAAATEARVRAAVATPAVATAETPEREERV